MKHRLFVFLPIALVYVAGFLLFGNWQHIHTRGDDIGYYLHVVSFWKYQDVGNYEQTLTSLIETHPEAEALPQDPYLIRTTDIGRKYIKYTLGTAVMESPFFLLADAYANSTDAYATHGWSEPYYFLIALSNVLYVLAGLWLLCLLLDRHFTPTTVVLSMIGVALATNLYFQATYMTMSHGFLFFDYCLLLWLSIRFYKAPNRWSALGIGAVVGLITITRIPELISVVIPLLWGVTTRGQLKERLQFLLKNYHYLLAAAVGFLVLMAIQISYWHYVSGQLIFNPYEGEGFNFLQPHIWDGLFSFRNGWLIYTPIMLFSLVGLFFLKRHYAAPFVPILVFVGAQAYIHYSYYAWWFFPGLGSRPMVEAYPLLAFGLAAFIQTVLEKPPLRWLPYILVGFFLWLNLFQTWQMKEGVIYSPNGSFAFYYETFGTMHPDRNALRAYDLKDLQPDTSEIQEKQVLAMEDFEAPTFSETVAYSGQHAFYTKTAGEELILAEQIPLKSLSPGAWLKVEVQAYVAPTDMIWDRDRLANLILELWNEDGKRRRFRTIKIASHIGNTKHSIWHTGVPGQWGEASFFVKLPRSVQKGWTAKAYLLNNHGQGLYVDDFELSYYEEK